MFSKYPSETGVWLTSEFHLGGQSEQGYVVLGGFHIKGVFYIRIDRNLNGVRHGGSGTIREG